MANRVWSNGSVFGLTEERRRGATVRSLRNSDWSEVGGVVLGIQVAFSSSTDWRRLGASSRPRSP